MVEEQDERALEAQGAQLIPERTRQSGRVHQGAEIECAVSKTEALVVVLVGERAGVYSYTQHVVSLHATRSQCWGRQDSRRPGSVLAR